MSEYITQKNGSNKKDLSDVKNTNKIFLYWGIKISKRLLLKNQ